MNSLQRTGDEVGLTISKSKTRTLGFGETESVNYLDGEAAAALNYFLHLSSEVMSSGRLDGELKIRIGRVSGAFGQFFKTWRSKVSLTKSCICNTVVLTTLRHGSETWATNNQPCPQGLLAFQYGGGRRRPWHRAD